MAKMNASAPALLLLAGMVVAAGGCRPPEEARSGPIPVPPDYLQAEVPEPYVDTEAYGSERAVVDSLASAEPERYVTFAGVEPAEDDLLRLHYNDDPDTLNPITASDNVSNAFQRWVYETLAVPNFADPDEFLPGLATHWEFDEEELEFTIHLRRGVMWHPMELPSGEPLPPTEFTSRDVAFSFACVLNPHVDAAHIRSYYENPAATGDDDRYRIALEVVDRYTVKVRWTEPYLLAREFTFGGFPMIPRHVFSVDENGEPFSFDFSSREFAEGFNHHWANTLMCGTGPMQYHRWLRNIRLELIRNEDYWGPPFYFSRMVMTRISNTNTAIRKLMQNELDLAGIPEKDHFLQGFGDPAVHEGRVNLVAYEYPGFRYIGYNLNRPFLEERQVRQALAHATPVGQMIDLVFHGLAVPVTGPFLPGSSANDDSLPPIPYDLDEARRLLDEAGWRDTTGDGIRDKIVDGRRVSARFEMMIFSESPSFRTAAELYKDSLRRIGVHVDLTPTAWALMLDRLNSKEFDATLLGWGTSWKTDPFQLWHGSQADVPNSSNFVGYRNPEVDRLIEELRRTLDEERQVELYHQIHRHIYEDQPYTFLFSEMQTAGMHSRIENVRFYRIRPAHNASEWFSTAARPVAR